MTALIPKGSYLLSAFYLHFLIPLPDSPPEETQGTECQGSRHVEFCSDLVGDGNKGGAIC